jgi:predicted RNase H-like HicB family nuclease
VKKTDMRNFCCRCGRDPAQSGMVGYVPGFCGSHSQARALDELNASLHMVIEMHLEDGETRMKSEFAGTQNLAVA